MTAKQKQVANYLLAGCYMTKSKNHAGTYCFRVKTKNHCPVMNVHRLDKVLKEVLKKDKRGHYTMNKSLVRQLNGNHFIKQQYKKQLKNDHSNHKGQTA